MIISRLEILVHLLKEFQPRAGYDGVRRVFCFHILFQISWKELNGKEISWKDWTHILGNFASISSKLGNRYYPKPAN